MNGHRRRHGPMRVLILAGLLGLLDMAPHAQSGERFHGRLSVLPVDVATARTMSGSGEAHATLMGNSLVITGTFEGLSSPATVAHIHQAPLARRGPMAFTVEVTTGTNGEISGSLELDDAQRQALRNSEYYVQIHTETNTGGEIRGWLIPQTEQR